MATTALTLADVVHLRHSHREYASAAVDPQAVAHILDSAERLRQRCGFAAPRLVAVPRGPDFERIARAAAHGLAVNQWLRSTPASHLLLCAAAPTPGQDLLRAVEEAAMCMEVAVLAATELGLATCWMTGIDHARVEEAQPLADGARLVALSPLGHPAAGGRLRDLLLHAVMPKDRKPLAEVTMAEVWR